MVVQPQAGSTLLCARRILICLRYGIGDVVMELPLLETLRHAAPEAHITAMGAAPAIEVLEGAGLVDEIVRYDRWGIRHFWDSGDGPSEANLVLWLEQSEFDVVLDAPYAPVLISRFLTRAGIRSLSVDEPALESALARGANGAEALAAAAFLGWELPVQPKARPAITLSACEVEFAHDFLTRRRIRRPVIGLCPLASSSLKRWPVSAFAAVADWAIENICQTAVLFAAARNTGELAVPRLMTNGARCAVVQGLHLRHVAAVLAECAVLVTNDTGLMHMAAAVQIPVVAVFGPTNPSVYLPRGRSVGLSHGLECPHRAHRMSPPGCWASDQCLIAPDNCTVAVPPRSAIEALQTFFREIGREPSKSGCPMTATVAPVRRLAGQP